MFAQVHFPNEISGEELDRYLADGWFRMGQTIFTTNFLNFKNQFYSAIWLRLALASIDERKAEQKIQKLRQKFCVHVAPAQIDLEREKLFACYRSQVSFEPSSSIHALLFGRSQNNIFQTFEVTIRDSGRLIGCGYFDLGKKATAGITSFYDPAYKKYSLGKFLIFQKIAFSKKEGYEFFYPGYFVPGYSPFDYKLKIYSEVQQYFDLSSGRWKPVSELVEGAAPFQVMKIKLGVLHDHLTAMSIPSSILKYEYYDANLIPDLSHMELFDYPLFIQYFDFFESAINSVVVFDVRDNRYHWLILKSVWKADQQPQSEDSYAAHLLKTQEEVISTEDPYQMAQLLSAAIKTQLINQKLS